MFGRSGLYPPIMASLRLNELLNRSGMCTPIMVTVMMADEREVQDM